MRRSVGVLLLAAVAALAVSAAATPEASLDLGIRAFRAGDYTSAIVDLRAAADGFTPGVSHQTALVYLALAQFRLGQEEEARASIHRLLEAERTQPAYATLPLQTDADDYEALVAALVPDANLPRNMHLIVEDQGTALPPVRPASPDPEEPPATVVAAEAAADVRAEEIRKQTEQRIAGIQAEADRRIAAAQADADRRVAAAEAAAEARVAAAESAAEARVAAAESAPPDETRSQPVAPRRTESPSLQGSEALTSLRQADELARNGNFDGARSLYVRLAADRNVPREVLAESAVGLYRIGSYRESADAFRRMNVFARGEEDLRYYFAVALYETGHYREAQKELACALPFIQLTDDVARYRMKIEQSAALTVARNF